MGLLYVKIIEARKVAVRTSFFVNYPFIRVILQGGSSSKKESKNTSYRPGIEWWDKILCYKVWKYNRMEQTLLVQARDKSIHVFGSDWLGEIKVYLKDIADGQVHQMWLKFGPGTKRHSRTPRGYVHIAFQYFDETNDKPVRPFTELPVEPVQTFEEYLASSDEHYDVDENAMKSFKKQAEINEKKLEECAKSLSSEKDEKSTKKKEKSKSKKNRNIINPSLKLKHPYLITTQIVLIEVLLTPYKNQDHRMILTLK